VKGFMPGVEKIATSPNKKLRDLGISFYEECYKWMGEAVLPLVEKLNKP
jgi:cytoskeleton-associated protein 5